MADAGAYGEARTGIGLWALLVGAILLVMELILFAALVPAGWSEQVRATELAWLHEGLGPRTADAVVGRAEQWFEALFVAPGLVETSYRITLPSDADVRGAGALSPLATLPLWSWVADRLAVIWAALYQALQRLAMLAAWWPFLLLLLAAASGDGWVRRRIRQSRFSYSSPLAHAYAVRGILIIEVLLGLVLFLPVPLPVFGVPLVGVLLAVLVSVTVANAQKRL
ncbi:DUF4400 domain-containing protein [Thiococcus pfennigii]|uniref:DUF4400 domain-containing protein n=1 Tax=Thiococcus pfennigii TaxID=1057 RepID=UPI001A93008E|nr:DUF4400 domain-containing protein [Thiococcus pfennigii]